MMFRWLRILIFVFIASNGYSQQALWINELDSDTPGLDDHEFIELKSAKPYFALDDYVVVFFNGADKAGNASYYTVAMQGYITDINGLFVIGNAAVQPFPNIVIPDNTIQNGADGVAIYKRSEVDFPIGTAAFVDNTLVDVLVYGTNDPDATAMLDVFRTFNPNIKQINEGKSNNTNSIQRDNNGGYFVALPTPRRNNDGTGIDLIGLHVVFQNSTYNEGDTIVVKFETEKPVEDDLVLTYSLNYGNFNASDYIATTRLSILKGTTSVTTSIILVDDQEDEGDEEMLFVLDPLPGEYLLLNNNIKIRVVDNDFKVSNFGTPLEPTYGRVLSTQPSGYYDRLDGLRGETLKKTLQDIIADESIVRAQTYNDIIDILKEADQNPKNSNQVWLVYTEQGRSKIDFQLTSENIGAWNREHVWPRSRGVFYSIEGDNAFDGIDVYWHTNADSLRHGNSDGHHIRAVDGPENSKRGNQFYGQYTGPANTAGSFRGDVARSIFYMAVRYNGLQVVEGYPESEPGKFGDLATLLTWHRADPSDDYEMNRNNVVQKWQRNRNPFIDMPELVEYIWGDKKNEIWHNPVATNQTQIYDILVYPNPSSKILYIKGLLPSNVIEISDIHGNSVLSAKIAGDSIDIHKLNPGIYFVNIFSQNRLLCTKKIIVN